MQELILTTPSLAYAAQLLSYKQETLAIEPHINGVGGLDSFEDIALWLEFLHQKADETTCPPGFVPDSSWLCIRQSDNRLVGMINIRHRLNDWLLDYGGHIGYSVRPDERGKGYAKAQLRLALDKCRALQLPRVLLTCDEDNEASRRTILSCGGVYEDTRTKPDGERLQRYWITL